METNIVLRTYQAARNTVKKRDFERDPGPTQRIENFLTEMVALAAVADPGPLVEALIGIGALGAAAARGGVEVSTQQRVLGRPRPDNQRTWVTLDLVVAPIAASRPTEIWLELKAGAGFHGTQLEDYLYAINQAVDGIERRLVVLDYAPTPRWKPQLPHGARLLTWDELRDSGARSSSRLWRDLARFLDKRVLATVLPEPSDEDIQLTSEALTALFTRLVGPNPPGEIPSWVRGPTSLRAVRSRLLSKRIGAVGELVIWGAKSVPQFRVGVYQSGRPELKLGVGTSRWYPVTHDKMRRIARGAGLSPSWTCPDDRDDDIVAAAVVPLEEIADAAEAADWAMARLQELGSAGLLIDLDGDGKEITTASASPSAEALV
jgi:hypothetical protein